MTEFEEGVLKKLSNIEQQQAQIIEIINKSLDMALGEDTFNVDNFSELLKNDKIH